MSDRALLQIGEDGIGRLTLVRADVRNAIDPAMVEALGEAVEQARNADLKGLLIRADGPAFSVGGDVKYMGAHSDDLPGLLHAMVTGFHESLSGIVELPVPVVTAARGAVAGGALGLLWCADVTIVSKQAKLATGFLDLGLSGDGGSTWWLPRLVGLQRARQLMLSRRVISGEEAGEWGLVTAAVPDEEVDGEAERAIASLARYPRAAYAEIRGLLAGSLERDLAQGLGAEHDAMVRTAGTDDARERVEGFGKRR